MCEKTAGKILDVIFARAVIPASKKMHNAFALVDMRKNGFHMSQLPQAWCRIQKNLRSLRSGSTLIASQLCPCAPGKDGRSSQAAADGSVEGGRRKSDEWDLFQPSDVEDIT
jgi:hypothetical protein